MARTRIRAAAGRVPGSAWARAQARRSIGALRAGEHRRLILPRLASTVEVDFPACACLDTRPSAALGMTGVNQANNPCLRSYSRSEERRERTECVSTYLSRWSPIP